MPDFYSLAIVILFVLAVSDLIVGVSNDAVNFLNSSIGSKVASRKVIMIVASLGIFAGATFSSGMMEVARSGVFDPGFFTFEQVVAIFLAVMLTDIILLDVFNTFGMPTSTTVSIVFELLGAAVMVAAISVITKGESILLLGDYINTTKAIAIVSGIFLSILFAFTIGFVVQRISRVLFSFQYDKSPAWLSTLWAGLALSALTYFLIIKGVRGASFVTDEFLTWVDTNTLLLFAVSLATWVLVLSILKNFKVNPFKLVVLFGTFSLAMAFAGNDLVNFIGVPIAGLESFTTWKASGVEAGSFNVGFLKAPVRTNSLLLLAAGTIMILTLWFSKKAQSVTETEVNLGRQSEGHERFQPNGFARWLVRNSYRMSGMVNNLLPGSLQSRIDRSYQAIAPPVNGASFDLIRASVNLTIASMLVALATSLKLPLSTTYVSFMVAMGASLADRAWGRDSAVYRVSGVLNVIGGWLATALIAFTVAAVFALLIVYFKLPVVVVLLLLAVALLYKTTRYHKSKAKKSPTHTKEDLPLQFNRVTSVMNRVEQTVRLSIEGLVNEDRSKLQLARQNLTELRDLNETFQFELISSLKNSKSDQSAANRFVRIFDLEQEVVTSVDGIVTGCTNYVENVHESLTQSETDQLIQLLRHFSDHFSTIQNTGLPHSGEPSLRTLKHQFLDQTDDLIGDNVLSIQNGVIPAKRAVVLFSIYFELRDLVGISHRLTNLMKTPSNSVEPEIKDKKISTPV